LMALPAAVVSRSGSLLAANRLFAELVPHTVRKLDGRVRLADEAADRFVENLLAQPHRHSTTGSVRTVPIRGPGGKPTAILQVIPLNNSGGEVHADAAILAIRPVRPPAVPTPSILQRLFDLSPAEARVASALAARRTIAAIAKDFGVSRETVRSQTKTVFVKTGVKRQLDLAVLLSGLLLLKE
jgi:DNA-binding CsgD family transcriptional regulator